MQLTTLDISIIVAFFALSLLIGIIVSRKSGKSAAEFFLSGRSMPWWLLGISMVATTFSADTPNLVTQFVREDGISGNWRWWAFLLTGMLTVFVYAKLWRRSGVLTDLEFYELRYSGKEAAFLRGFRAIYLGVFFNLVIMATVCVAAIKIGAILLGLEAWETLLYGTAITVLYSALGGLRGVMITDFFQFFIAMAGAIGAAWYILGHEQINGLESLLAQEAVIDKSAFIPSLDNMDLFIGIFIIPLAVQWWSVWYPGAEPGGGGYIAQRMLSAKNEKHAVGATLLFNLAHYALRPWPWIIIALASLLFFPVNIMDDERPLLLGDGAIELVNEQAETNRQTLLDTFHYLKDQAVDIKTKEVLEEHIVLIEENPDHPEILSWAYIHANKNDDVPDLADRTDPMAERSLVRLQLYAPDVPLGKLGNDLAYSMMLSFLPPGLLGLVLVSLIAAFMSTISTHLNWGSSYVVNDFYVRFIRKDATDKQQVRVGRMCTILLMLLAAGLSYFLESAGEGFNVLLQIGAGTGLIFILRWFWWRVNAFTEIAGMIISFVVAISFLVLDHFGILHLNSNMRLIWGVGITTVGWLIVTFVTRPTSKETLLSFYQLIRPSGRGWRRILGDEVVAGKKGTLGIGVFCMLLGTIGVYCALFGTGYLLYGQLGLGAVLISVTAVCGGLIVYLWRKVV
jgi:Na+/proline symporter